MAEKRKIYHVSKRDSDGKWAIHIQGSETVIKLFSTKAEAETYCATLGANQKGTVLFHNSKGKAKGSIKTTQVHTKESVKAAAAKAETKSASKKPAAKATAAKTAAKPAAKKTDTKTAAKKTATKKK